jgi:Lon protease-like protein
MSRILENFPLFPISIIIFPGEIQPIHIFEKRYKQLINDMESSGEIFGIPFIKDGKLCEFGSGVVIHKILAKSPGGEMDILVRGVNLFKMMSIEEQLPGKLYAGGSVMILDEMNKTAVQMLQEKFITYKQQLSVINKMPGNTTDAHFPRHILDIAGQLPLEIDEKYKIIKLSNSELREQLLIEKLNFLLMINKKLQEVGYKFYLN